MTAPLHPWPFIEVFAMRRNAPFPFVHMLHVRSHTVRILLQTSLKFSTTEPCLCPQKNWTRQSFEWMSCLPACVCVLGQWKWAVVTKWRPGEKPESQWMKGACQVESSAPVCGDHYPPLIKGMASPRHMFRLGEPALTLKKLFAFCFVNCLCF